MSQALNYYSSSTCEGLVNKNIQSVTDVPTEYHPCVLGSRCQASRKFDSLQEEAVGVNWRKEERSLSTCL